MPSAGGQGRLTIFLRPATSADVDAVAHVHRHSRAAYYETAPAIDDGRERFWSGFLAQPDRSTWLAESRGDGVIGFVSVTRIEEPVRALELTSLYVLPDSFGEGVGSSLYDVFRGELREGETGLLEVWAGNRRALQFYARRGWTQTPKTRPGPQGVDFVTHRLDP